MPADISTMSCPVCQGSFREVLREGVLIDVCTQCRGVWLDRGELEKLLALARAEGDFADAPPPQRPAPQPQVQPQPQTYRQPPQQPYREPERYYKRDDDDDDDKRRHYGEYDKYGRKKKKGFDLGDIFDFG